MTTLIKNSELNELFAGDFELIVDGFLEGQFNMDVDYERTMQVSKNSVLPMLRFYGWKPWTVSLGFNQKDEEIDKVLISQKGFGLVKRPTGGRAVLHADELTYSVVLNLSNDITIHDIYRDIHAFLLSGLKKLGSNELDFEKSQADFREFYKNPQGLSVSCFASSARYEIAWKGKKVVGSAQRQFGKTLLQHGSILLGNGHEQLAEVIKTDNDSKRDFLRSYILNHSATLAEVCNRKISFDESVRVLINQIDII